MRKHICLMLALVMALVALCALSVSAADLDFTAGGTVSGTCQHCKTTVSWLPLDQAQLTAWGTNYDPTAGTHYYLPADLDMSSGSLSVAAGEELCLHMNGKTIDRKDARAFSVSGTLNLMDHAANKGTILCIGSKSSTGCVVRLAKAGATFNMYGGTLRMAEDGSFAGNGGCVYMVENTTFTMRGGVITGGRASAGGNVYVGKNCTFTMYGGTIEKGKTVTTAPSSNITVTNMYGGNVYMEASSSKCFLYGGTITGGYAAESGGNIAGSGVITMEGGTLSDGQAKCGGNLYLATVATANISGGTISGGEASDRGGNVYMAATNCKLNLTGGTIENGKSTNNGGNLFLNNGDAVISGGVIRAGQAGGNGGNLSVNLGITKNTNNLQLTGSRILDGHAAKKGGNVYVSGILFLGGATLTGGTADQGGSDLYLTEAGKLTLLNTFAGESYISFHGGHLPEKLLGGSLLTEKVTTEGAFPGKLYLEDAPNMPLLYGVDGEQGLYISAAALALKDGTFVWYRSNEAMLAADHREAEYMLVAPGIVNLSGGSYSIDLNGSDVTVTGSGDVTFFDSANKDYVSYGSATVTGVTVRNEAKTTIGGDTYYMVREGDTYSFHLLDLALTGVSLRPSNSGIYYTGTWSGDEKLATLVDSFGVAVSLKKAPGADFAQDGATRYTVFGADQLKAGATGNGVLIEDILSQSASATDNDKNGKKPIYAAAYLKLKSGEVILSDENAAYSLHKVMEQLNEGIVTEPSVYRPYRDAARKFYEAWKEQGLGGWDLKNLLFGGDDGVLDVLMIGNSFCYYFVEELEAMAEAAGVPMRVCNVYYGGCTLTQHYNWWKNGESNYSFYTTDEGVRKGVSNVGLEWCLNQGDWDVISLQQVSSAMTKKTAEAHLDETRSIRAELYDYLKKQFPAAEVYWHQVWAYELGYDRNNFTVETFEQQQTLADRNRTFAIGVCRENGVKRINTGEAWQIFRRDYVNSQTGLTDTLCARLGNNGGKGDSYHDGDVGGGQFLNACVWLEILTGKDCRENTYRPSYVSGGATYTLSETLVEALQASAHQAVAELRAWESAQ